MFVSSRVPFLLIEKRTQIDSPRLEIQKKGYEVEPKNTLSWWCTDSRKSELPVSINPPFDQGSLSSLESQLWPQIGILSLFRFGTWFQYSILHLVILSLVPHPYLLYLTKKLMSLGHIRLLQKFYLMDKPIYIWSTFKVEKIIVTHNQKKKGG